MQIFYPFHMRSSLKPTIPMPIACRSVGHFNVVPGWHNPPAARPFVQIFWGIKGRGRFLHQGKEYILKPHHVCAMFTDDTRNITALTQWEYRWFTLDGLMPDAVVRGFGLDSKPLAAGPCPQELFIRLSHEIEDISAQGQRAAGATAYEILSLAHGPSRTTPRSTRHVRQCVDLIRQNYPSPDLNVNWLATKVGIHRTNLSKLFQEKMRVSPVEYLIMFRVSKALKLLQGTDLPVRQIAQMTGFSCPNYFTNVMRKRIGLSPREIRRQTLSSGAAPQTP